METAALTTLKNSLAGSGTRLSPNIAKTFESSLNIGASLLNLTWEPGSLFCSNLPVLIVLVLKSTHSKALYTVVAWIPPAGHHVSAASLAHHRPHRVQQPLHQLGLQPEAGGGFPSLHMEKSGGHNLCNFRAVIISIRCNFHISIKQIYPIEMCT